jgi:hypothetical protein
MSVRVLILAAATCAALGCGRIGYEGEPSSLAIDSGSGGTPPDAAIYDAARSDDGSLLPPIDGGTGIVSNLLVQKSGDPDWTILSGPKLGGAYAQLDYEQSGPTFRYRLDAQGLPAATSYLLVQFNDPWPGVPAEDIASFTSSATGTINQDWTEYEFNRDLLGGEKKLWLVLDGHVDTANDEFNTWSPNDYLFEVDFLSYDDTDI